MMETGIVICGQCGERGLADTQFCGVCGAFLKWDGEQADEKPVPQGTQPDVVQPAEQRAPQRQGLQVPDEPPPLNPGDLICGNCGLGNVPSRKFCGRCGASLAQAETVAVPWWRRFFPARKAKELEAGTRPRRRRGSGEARRRVGRVVRRTIAVAVVVAGVLYATVPPLRSAVNTQAVGLKNEVAGIFVTQYAPVRPTKVIATAANPDHGANLVSDNASNTYWSASGDREQALVLTFDRAVDLRKAIVRIGIGADFQSAHRPQKLHLVYSTGKTYDLSLVDIPDAQEVTLENSAGSTSVELHVVALHRSLQGNDVAISEIELFEAKS
ncbi:NADase-type glycan-binding domain-containing protein [Amycolatopsis sp.]|jgi:hypothetical protein|uniref:NADase-type glycan-binding domain-containing protein n=1 Tax=Amycolatopsis sp. TaxID=37632 RepID=UPI002DFED685|nr:zinc ribbon domain-containing protein [Amycolatopsis sp.]